MGGRYGDRIAIDVEIGDIAIGEIDCDASTRRIGLRLVVKTYRGRIIKDKVCS